MNIQREAVEFILQHGDSAPIHAPMEADTRLEAGDMNGAAHWRLVLAALPFMVKVSAGTT